MTDDITKAIERAKELDRGATKGPWRWAHHSYNQYVKASGLPAKHSKLLYLLIGPTRGRAFVTEGDLDYWRIHDRWDHYQVAALPWHCIKGDTVINAVPTGADADFIAESRTLLPQLVAEVERLTEKCADLEADAEGTDIYIGVMADTLGVKRIGKDLSCVGHAIERLVKERDNLKERCARDDAGVTIHECPPKGSGIMPCCSRPPFEVKADRMTTNPALVNCDRVRHRDEAKRLLRKEITHEISCPRFQYGMNKGFHGSEEQRASVKNACISMLAHGDSVLIRGPFRVGKSTLLHELATAFDGTVIGLYAADQADDFPQSGRIFLDEAGFLAPSFWEAIPKGLQICAVLPDSRPVPPSWTGQTVRLDAFLKTAPPEWRRVCVLTQEIVDKHPHWALRLAWSGDVIVRRVIIANAPAGDGEATHCRPVDAEGVPVPWSEVGL